MAVTAQDGACGMLSQSVHGSDYDSVGSRTDDVRAGYSTVLLYEH